MAALPLTTSIPTTRVFCSRKPARARRFASFTPRASTTWTLDGVGCAGSRSGDEQLLRSAAPANRCPLKPIDVSSLCEAHEGKFEMQDVIFEQEGGRLFVTALWDADAEASSKERPLTGKFYYLFIKLQEAWSNLTSQVSTAGFTDDAKVRFELKHKKTELPKEAHGTIVVDGFALPAKQKWMLRPGALLRIGSDEFQVFRNVHAHA